MRVANRRLAAALGAALGLALVLTVWVNSIRADDSALIPAFYDDVLVYLKVPSQQVVGVDNPAIKLIAEEIYFLDGQPKVVSSIPGVPGYNPWWHVNLVTVYSGGPYTSEEQIWNAYEYGEVDVTPTDIYLLCPVDSK